MPTVEDPIAELQPISGFPKSEKVYVEDGGVRVPVRRVHLTGGEAPFDVYDTSGPENHDLHHGLPKLRKPWIDARMADFCAARSQDEVLAAFEGAEAAAAPIFDMADIAADPHYTAREATVEVDGVRMQGLVARLSETPGAVRWAGRPLDADPPEWVAPT